MPSRAMNRLFVESASGSGGCRDAEPVLCAPRPRRVQVHPCSADLILGPPPFLLNKVLLPGPIHRLPLFVENNFVPSKISSSPPKIYCPSSLTKTCPLLLQSSKEGGRTKPAEVREEEDAGCWAVFGGSPPARADNPLVHDPHFLLNQQRHPAADPTPLELGFFDHRSRTSYVHRPTYSSSSSSNNSNNSSFAPSSFAPAVRIQGFDVAACRSSHSNGGSRVLSARA